MKRLVYIGLFAFGLVLVSCQKQEITPNDGRIDVPVWDCEGMNRGNEGTDEGGLTDPTDPTGNDDGDVIVDPNNDGDGRAKQ